MSSFFEPHAEADGALRPADFLLGPEAFLGRCHQVFPSALLQPNSPESDALLCALRQGARKFDIVDAFKFAYDRMARPVLPDLDKQIRDELTQHPTCNDLIALAPGDDKLFVDFLLAHFFATEPPPVDRLAIYSRLKSGAKDREAVVRWLSSLATDSTLRLSDAVEPMREAIALAGPVRQSFEIGIDAGMWLQKPQLAEGGHGLLEPGWVLAGPKRNLQAGLWTAVLQFWQPAGARIIIDVVANSGLKTFMQCEMEGAAAFSAAFDVRPSDRMIEVRIYKPLQAEEFCRFSLTKLVLKPTMDGQR